MTVGELKAKLSQYADTTTVRVQAADEDGVPGPIDINGVLDVSTPNGTEVYLELSIQTGDAATAPDAPPAEDDAL